MIRKLATAVTLQNHINNIRVTLNRKVTSCCLHSVHSGRRQLCVNQGCGNSGRSSSTQCGKSTGYHLALLYRAPTTTTTRMFCVYNPYSYPPWNQVPYQTNYIDGPMLPKTPIKKKKKKKKKKPEKIIPPMDSVEQTLEKMRIRFDEIEKEHLSPNRGIRTVKWIAGKKCEGMHKTVTTKMANSILNSWVYCRHALLHGHYQLNDMTKKELAESLLGKGTKTKVPDRDARLILKELFRFGVSNHLDRYMKLHMEKMKMMGRAIVNAERNRLGVPKIRNLASVEEMAAHGFAQEEVDEELQSRLKKDENRKIKKIRKEMPAYLRHEVSGARRQEARKIHRILRRKEKKKELREAERARRLGLFASDDESEAPITIARGEDDTDDEDDDDGENSDDDSDDSDYDSSDDDDEEEDSDEDESDSDDENTDDEDEEEDKSDRKKLEKDDTKLDEQENDDEIGTDLQNDDESPNKGPKGKEKLE